MAESGKTEFGPNCGTIVSELTAVLVGSSFFLVRARGGKNSAAQFNFTTMVSDCIHSFCMKLVICQSRPLSGQKGRCLRSSAVECSFELRFWHLAFFAIQVFGQLWIFRSRSAQVASD